MAGMNEGYVDQVLQTTSNKRTIPSLVDAALPLSGAELIPIVQGGNVKKVASSALMIPGPQGPAGQGVPTGGTIGQVLAKASGTDYDTEWVNQSGGGGTPGGSSTQLQYNNGGAFGGMLEAVWNSATNQLGIGVTNIADIVGDEKLKLNGNQTLAIPDAPINPVVSINYGAGGGYSAGVFTHTYRIYSSKVLNGTTFYSPVYLETIPVTDDGRTVTPNDVTGATGAANLAGTGYVGDGSIHNITVYGYLTRMGGTAYSVVGNLSNDVQVNPTTAPNGTGASGAPDYLDTGFLGDGTTWTLNVWPYVNTVGGPVFGATSTTANVSVALTTAPDVTNFAANINYAETGYIANGDTWNFTIWAYNESADLTRVGSVNGAFATVTDDGSTNPYGIDLTWDDMSALGYIIVRDNGVTSESVDVGNVTSFIDDNTLWAAYGSVPFSPPYPTSYAQPFAIDWAWDDKTVDGYMLQLDDGTNFYQYDAGNTLSLHDNFTVWSAGAPDVSQTSYQPPFSIDYAWDDVTVDGYILVNESGYWADVGNVTSISDDNTIWVNPPTFSNTPNSVTDDYSVGVSWDAVVGADGYIILVEDDVTPKAYDYYYSVGGAGANDDNSAATPVPSLAKTKYFDVSLNASGDILFSGKIIGSDQFGSNNLIFGQDITPNGNNNAFFGVANTISNSYLNSSVVGVGNTVAGGNYTTVFGAENNISGGNQFQTIVGIQNIHSGDGIYSFTFGYANTVTARLSTTIGQSNTNASTRSVIAGVICNSSGSDHVFVAGYQTSVTASESTAIGYQVNVAGVGSIGLGYGTTVNGANGFGVGSQNTTGGNQSGTMGYGNSTSAQNAYSIGFSSSASASRAMAIGSGANAVTSGHISLCQAVNNGDLTTVNIQGKSTGSGAATRDMINISTVWQTSTNASRRARAIFNVFDTAAREVIRMEASGSAPMLGLFGVNAVVQPSTTGTTTGFTAGAGTGVNNVSTFTGNLGTTAYTIGDIVRALKQVGIMVV